MRNFNFNNYQKRTVYRIHPVGSLLLWCPQGLVGDRNSRPFEEDDLFLVLEDRKMINLSSGDIFDYNKTNYALLKKI